MQETWLPIPGFDGYRASDLGRIVGPRRILKQFDLHKRGYFYVHIRKKMLRVNRLIAITFLGPPPSSEHQAAHIDGKKDNNRKTNLKWATSQENNDDKLYHGTMLLGEKHPRSRLTRVQVNWIRRDFAQHMRLRHALGFVRQKRGTFHSTAMAFGVDPSTIMDIVRGRTWSDPNYRDSVAMREHIRQQTKEASHRYRANKAKRKAHAKIA